MRKIFFITFLVTAGLLTSVAWASDVGHVDFVCYSKVASQWLQTDCYSYNSWCDGADLNYDCGVDMKDLALVAEYWLESIPQVLTVPDGMFDMGDNLNEGASDEQPVHSVYLNSFFIGKYPVTNQQYCDFLNNALAAELVQIVDNQVCKNGNTSIIYCDTTASSSSSQITLDNNIFSPVSDKANHPMVAVSWYGAAAYCNWRSQREGYWPLYDESTWTCDFTQAGYRLPTEAEREYAARGGLYGERYPWGDSIVSSQVNYQSSLDPYETGAYPWTTPVGFYDGTLHYKTDYNWPDSQSSYQTTSNVNGFGLYDMAGNVQEWCYDWYSAYISDYQENPTGPESGTNRIIRGSNWHDPNSSCRAAYRAGSAPESRSDDLGFRIVLDLKLGLPG